ncbi:hypothetical protein [Streptomyces coriariae]|uniref:hypothetical protein n=1 Tax=Streptomyces coriariae TaxID=2864460 RepID=UPI0022822359|nr:hypothetical protein [Streptomyces coriariae]
MPTRPERNPRLHLRRCRQRPLRTDPTSTTLYLPGEQLILTGTTTGVRHLSLAGGGTVVRIGTGTNYRFQISDPHGTSSLYLDNTAQTLTCRQFTPYGGTRGTTAGWLDNRGFLNAPDNADTGLTQFCVGLGDGDDALGDDRRRGSGRGSGRGLGNAGRSQWRGGGKSRRQCGTSHDPSPATAAVRPLRVLRSLLFRS